MAEEEKSEENGPNSEVNSEETAEFNEIIASFQDGQLSCVGQDLEEIPRNLIDDYSKVTRRLDLSFNRLKSLKGLEEFLNLEELILDNNEVSDDIDFPVMERLHTLTLNKNKLSNLEKLLDALNKNVSNLTYLSLLGNMACPNQLSSLDKDEEDYTRYRYYVLYRLPSLKFLDSRVVSKTEVSEAKRVGPFMAVVRGKEDESPETEAEGANSQYSPLPDSAREPGTNPMGTFGKSRYVYYGKHSEGNRFIRNNDL